MLNIDRIKNILLTPRSEWEVIAGESGTAKALYAGYVIPLAAIRPICAFIGLSLVGISALGSTYRMPIGSGIAHAIVDFVLTLVGVYVLALIIDALAPSFGGTKNQMQALKVSAYSATPAWLAGVLYLLPSLSILGAIAGLYSLYLLYLGLPAVMKAHRERALGYTVVVIVAAVVIFVVIGAVASAVVPHPAMNLGGLHG